MLNLAKYATIAALAGGLGVAASEPASAWGYGYYSCGDGCGYGYGAFGPYAYGFAYPYYGYYGYRPFYRHHYYGFYDPGRLGLVAILPLERALWRSRRSFPPIEASENRSYRKRADEARKAAATTAREAASLTASLRKLEWLKTRADAELAFVDKALAAAKTDQARARAEDLKQKAAPKAAEAGTHFDAAKTEATSKLAAAAAAKDAAKAAETKKADAAKAANEAKLALEPVSVYISRATQKLYVRRNTHKPWPDGCEVFDATIEVPVTIRNPNKPIGTHVFTAVARNGAGLRWTAVTIDNGDDAKDALDRITIPQNVLDRIAPTALPRSSIILSDEPLSSETNYRTEFVAVLNNQPQGGFVTRQPSDNVRGDDGFGSFSNAIGTPNLAIRGGAAARAGGKTWHAARRPHGRSGSFRVVFSACTPRPVILRNSP